MGAQRKNAAQLALDLPATLTTAAMSGLARRHRRRLTADQASRIVQITNAAAAQIAEVIEELEREAGDADEVEAEADDGD